MIKIQVGTNADGSPRMFTMSWISAVALHAELTRELRFEDLRDEEKRRVKKSC